jgi:transglutaminase-like putative cysteine protease
VLPLLLALTALAGCGQSADVRESETDTPEQVYTNEVVLETVDLEDEMVALSDLPAAIPDLLTPVASGTKTKSASNGVIDYSNIQDGYVMARYTASTTKALKAQVKGPTTTYTYSLTAGQWATFPLSDGNGDYQVTVYENVSDSKYAAVVSASFTVKLTDEFAPFLRPNQYVDYASAPKTVEKAAELTKGMTDTLDKVQVVYDYVVATITYDRALAATVQSGYLPVLDTVLEKKTGICFDYAALMTGMLRSQNVPCKLVVGYAGTAYHAWVEAYCQTAGTVDGVLPLTAGEWTLLDPTFVSGGDRGEEDWAYVTNRENYQARYVY